MSAYCQINDVYNLQNNKIPKQATDDVDLDKLARQVNNQKIKDNRDIYRNFRSDKNILDRGVSAFNNFQKYDKGTNVQANPTGFFSAQGEYGDFPTGMYDSNLNLNPNYDPNYNTNSDIKSNGTLISDIYMKKQKQKQEEKNNTSKNHKKNKILVRKKNHTDRRRDEKKNIFNNMMHNNILRSELGNDNIESLDLDSARKIKQGSFNSSDSLEFNSSDSLEFNSSDSLEFNSLDSLDSLNSLDSVESENNNYNNNYSKLNSKLNRKIKNERHMLLDSSNSSDSLDISDMSIPSYGLNSKNKRHSSIKRDTMSLEDIYDELKKHNYKNNRSESKKTKCIDYDLQSVDSIESLKSGESLFNHINYCERCKDHVINLIRKSRNSKNSKNSKNDKNSKNLMRDVEDDLDTDINVSNNNIIVSKNNGLDNLDNFNNLNNSGFSYYSLELKEILTVCLIGFIVIIILDLSINYKNN